jgi:hypothetical protein|nr:MAG TPA: hypothetical protein [Caudoviricetes sp.]
MKVVVTNGYVTVGSILHAAGVALDLPDGVAKNLLMNGVVELPEMVLQDGENPDTEDIGDNEQDGENSDTEDPNLDSLELPSVDPVAAARKPHGRKK